MNIKNSLSTLGFCLLFTAKIFGGIGIEDLAGITLNGACSVSQSSCTPAALTVTAQKEYICNWTPLPSCTGNNSYIAYNVSLVPNLKGLTTYDFTITENGMIKLPTPLFIVTTVDIANDIATINNYFTVKIIASGFKIKFKNDLNFSKYTVKITKCCRTVTCLGINPPPPPPSNGNKVSAYPNPTNGVFNIEYGLTQQSNASILVFDRYNRLVKQVVKDEKQEIGNQNIQFDTYDLNDGIYYIRIQTGNEVVTKTMVVNKYSNY